MVKSIQPALGQSDDEPAERTSSRRRDQDVIYRAQLGSDI